MPTHDWYTVLAHGEAAHTQYPALPHGPWRGESAADAALDRWVDRLPGGAASAGEAMAAMSVRIAGPFRTRFDARSARRS